MVVAWGWVRDLKAKGPGGFRVMDTIYRLFIEMITQLLTIAKTYQS